MNGRRPVTGPANRKEPQLQVQKKTPGRQILEVVKKYTSEKEQPEDKLAGFAAELSRETKAKALKYSQLEQTWTRINSRRNNFLKLQTRVKDEEKKKVKWYEDEYKRVKIENSCLNIEKKKLRLQIEDMRNEIAKMITEDEEKRLYFEAGVPITQKHETNFSQMYNYSKKDAYTVKHIGKKPKTVIVGKKVSRMGNFTSSPDVKVNDTYKVDHRRFEKMKNAEPQETFEAEESGIAQSDDGTKTCILLNRIKLSPKRPEGSKPVLKNILTGVHKPSILGSPKLNSMSKSFRGRAMFKSHDVDAFKTNIKNEEDSVTLSRSRFTMIQHSRPASKISVKSKNSKVNLEDPREKADQVLVRMDNIAKEKFGQGYIDWIAVLVDVNNKILKVEKKIKKRIKFNRQTLLVTLNLVLCFKKAFYILKFHYGILKRSVKGPHQNHNLQSRDLYQELDRSYVRLSELAVAISEYSKRLLNPTLEAKLEPIKLMKFKRDESTSSFAQSLGWTPKLGAKKMLKTSPESFDLQNQVKKEDGPSNSSVLSTPHSSPHLKALEPFIKKPRIYDVSRCELVEALPRRGRRTARKLQHQ